MSIKKKPKDRIHSGTARGQESTDSVVFPGARRFCLIAFLLLAGLRIASAFFPEERLWGLNHLAYVPIWFSILLSALGILSCTPLAARYTRSVITWLYQFYIQLTETVPRTILYLLLSIGFGSICWLCAIQYPFFGDGPQYLLFAARILVGDENSPSPIHLREPLTSSIYFYLSKLTPATTSVSVASGYVQLVYRLTAAALGGMFLFIVLSIAHRIARQVPEKFIVIVSLLACAGSLFFFGYVEYYTFVYVSIALYCYTAIAYCDGKMDIIVPILMFILSVAFHFLALILFPSLLYLVLSHRFEKVRCLTFRQASLTIGIIAITCFAIYLYMYLAPQLPPIVSQLRWTFTPLLSSEHYGYSLFSSYRLADLLNELSLLSQTGLVFLLAAGLFLRRYISWDHRRTIFLLFATVFCIMFIVTLNAGFGLGIDWDLLASVGLVLTFAGICLIVPIIQKSQWKWNLASMVIGGAGMSIVPWIALNVNSDLAVQRFHNLIDMDAAHLSKDLGYRYETIRKYYLSKGRETEELNLILEMIQYSGGARKEYDKFFSFIATKNPGKYRGQFLATFDSVSRAVEKSTESSAGHPNKLPSKSDRQRLYDVYSEFLIFGAGTYNMEILDPGERFKSSFPNLPQGYEILGWHYFLKDDFDSALQNFQHSSRSDEPRLNTLIGLAKVYYHFAQGAKGQELQAAASKALRFYEEAEAIEPQPWIQISGEMGYLYSALNQYPKAREHFQRYLEVDKHSAFAQRIKEDLSKLQGLK